MLERLFKLREHQTTLSREVVGGATTFLALSYIIFVQPGVMRLAGVPHDGAFFATCVASAAACFLMGLLANYPVALAPAMGHNFLFAFTICGAMGFTWQQALAANLVAGAVFMALGAVGFRRRIMEALPDGLKFAIAAGIGLLISFVGLQYANIVVDQPATFVQLGTLGHPVALLSLFGLAVTAILLCLRVRGAILIGAALTAGAGLLAVRAGWTEVPLVIWHGVVGTPPSPASSALKVDFPGLFGLPWTQWLTVIVVFLILDLFDTIGTLVGVAERAGLMKDGQLPRAGRALFADATGTVLGAALGTSTITSYVESAAGVAAGARTGLATIVTGVLLLAAMGFYPVVEMFGSGVNVAPAGVAPMVRYPVIAPALILIGVYMIPVIRRIDWDDLTEAIPAFLTMVVMMMAFSITDGIAWGFITYTVLKLVTGKVRQIKPLVAACAVLFVIRYIWLVG